MNCLFLHKCDLLHPSSVYILVPLACFATLLGGWLIVRFLHDRASVMRHISGVAAGYLVSATLVRILPEAIHLGGDTMPLWALGGFLVVHVIEHGITPHFHYGEESCGHKGTAMTGIMALLGLSLHSFLDGVSISAAMHTQATLGIIVFLGVLLHRVPEGATISSIFLVSGFGRRSALYAAGALAIAALFGAICQDIFKLPVGLVLAVAAGLGFYVACAYLLPQTQKEKGWKSTVSLAAGILIFVATNSLLPHVHEHESLHVHPDTEKCCTGEMMDSSDYTEDSETKEEKLHGHPHTQSTPHNHKH